MKKQVVIGVVLLMVVALCAWAPWLTERFVIKVSDVTFSKGTECYPRFSDFKRKLFSAEFTMDSSCPGDSIVNRKIYSVSFIGVSKVIMIVR